MFAAEFCEIQTRREGGLVTVPEVWHIFEVPASVTRSLNRAKDRMMYDLAMESPVRVPAKAGVALRFLGRPVLSAEYGHGAKIPVARAGTTVGCPDYAALPADMWVQINPKSDDFVLQVKLQKMAPGDARDPGTGDLYVYGVARLVVQVSLPQAMLATEAATAEAAAAAAAADALASDRDRALRI